MSEINNKKKLDADLLIIAIATVAAFLAMGLVNYFLIDLNEFAKDTDANVILRLAVCGSIWQFGIAGLGIVLVSLIRQESFSSHGLVMKNIIPACIISLAVCIPDFIYNYSIGNVHAWMPFIDVHFTREWLAGDILVKMAGFILTIIPWGFFEGFNYIFISDKLNERFPTGNKWINIGGIVCVLMCFLMHGAVGVTYKEIMDMIVTGILIYGIIMAKEITGNAWGSVLVFCVYWNAL